MAGKKERKKLESEKALAAFWARVGDKELTKTQETEEAQLVAAVRVEKFRVTGKKHLDRILTSCDALAKCANPKKFTYTAAQVEKIAGALSSAMAQVKGAFEGKVTRGIEL